MDNNTSKIELVKLILNINNDNFIKRIAEIKKGIEQLDKGKRTSYKEVLKKIS